jgi:hypothetical protein
MSHAATNASAARADRSAPPPGGAAPAVAPTAVPRRLDDLLALGPDALRALYEGATVPAIPDLSGDLRGRMLAWHGLRGAAAAAVRALGGWDRFPWRGKSFRHADAQRGGGDNRVLLERWHLFRFDTFVGPSRAGAFDAVQLDYDQPGNPFFIRAIKDEVRQLRPGLWLGQAYVQVGQRAPSLVLYFGLEQRQ